MTSKHLWMLNHYAQTPDTGSSTRHFNLAKALPGADWRASVIASGTLHNSDRRLVDDGATHCLSVHDGVPFLWLRTSRYRGNGADRMKNMLDFTRRALDPATTAHLERPDAIIGSSVHPFAAWAGLRLARRHNVPFLFEVRDLWPQTLIDLGRLSERDPRTFFLRRLERHLYHSAACTIVLLPQAHEYIVPLGVPRERVVWIPNGVNLEQFKTYPYPMEREDAPFTFMYMGAHGTANGLDNILQAMALARDRYAPAPAPLRLRLIGDGPLRASLIKKSEDLGLVSLVSFEAAVPKAEIVARAGEADAFVFNLVDAPVFRYGISSNKLFDYLAAARPVVFACQSPNNPVAESDAGITVPPGRPDLLADAMLKLAHTPREQLAAMGAAGRTHVSTTYDYTVLAGRLASTLDLILAQDDARPEDAAA